MALAAKAIGKFAGQATKDSPEGIEPFVKEVVRDLHEMSVIAKKPVPCNEFEETLITGVKRIWPKLTVAQKFEMALAAGSVRV